MAVHGPQAAGCRAAQISRCHHVNRKAQCLSSASHQGILPSPPLPLLPFSYSDLLAHWQLKAALRGDAPPYDASQLSDVIEATGTTTQALMKLEREAESYWVAEYFRQAARWGHCSGVVRRMAAGL